MRFLWRDNPPVGQGLPISEVSRSHKTTHHSRQDSSGRVISSSQRPLSDNTQHSQQTNIHAPGGIRTQSQQASGRRPTALTARSLGLASFHITLNIHVPDIQRLIVSENCSRYLGERNKDDTGDRKSHILYSTFSISSYT